VSHRQCQALALAITHVVELLIPNSAARIDSKRLDIGLIGSDQRCVLRESRICRIRRISRDLRTFPVCVQDAYWPARVRGLRAAGVRGLREFAHPSEGVARDGDIAADEGGTRRNEG
jgi:hypothetical protein